MESLHNLILKSKGQTYIYSAYVGKKTKSVSLSVLCSSSMFLAHIYFPLLIPALTLFLYFGSFSNSLF